MSANERAAHGARSFVAVAQRGAARTVQHGSHGGAALLAALFPEEPWDGIRASDEEKRQAREP